MKYSNPLCHCHGFMLVVGDINGRFALLQDKPSKLRTNILSQLRIKIAHRFIKQINLRLP